MVLQHNSKHGSLARKPNFWHTLYRSVWFFPAVLLLILLILTSLRISGTSIGMYHEILYGTTPAAQKDPDLLAGSPEPIRSDEWLYVTQMTIAQQKANYPLFNKNISSGRNMSVVGYAPYKDWSSLFRPENLSFFVMPLAFAFAFKWWLILFLTMVSAYFVALRFFPGKRLFASLFGIAVGCTPFMFWWYQTSTFAPIFYGFFIVLLGLRIINGEGVPFLKRFGARWSYLALGAAVAYVLVCFGLILYPPFQVPIAITVAAVLAAAILQHRADHKTSWRVLGKRLGVLIGGAALAGILMLLFIHTRSAVVSAVEDTAYPGTRIVASGHTPLSDALGSFLMPQLEHQARAAHYFTNQSEASNFLLFLPFLLVPGFALIGYEWRARHRCNWTLLATQLAGLLFLAIMYVPGLDLLDKLTFLDKVPHQRLLIGLGFAGVLQLLCLIETVGRLKLSGKKFRSMAGVYAFACFCVLLGVGEFVRKHYPFFLHSWAFIGLLAFGFSLIIFLAMTARRVAFAIVFLAFSLASVYRIHPLYVGLGLAENNQITSAIDHVSPPGSTWAVLDDIFFENFPAMAGRDSLSGIQLYPDMSFWKQFDSNPKDSYIYNRYAHVLFTSSAAVQNLQLLQSDTFEVKFACTPTIEQHVQYVMTITPLNDACVHQVDVVKYPAATFYFYRVD